MHLACRSWKTRTALRLRAKPQAVAARTGLLAHRTVDAARSGDHEDSSRNRRCRGHSLMDGVADRTRHCEYTVKLCQRGDLRSVSQRTRTAQAISALVVSFSSRGPPAIFPLGRSSFEHPVMCAPTHQHRSRRGAGTRELLSLGMTRPSALLLLLAPLLQIVTPESQRPTGSSCSREEDASATRGAVCGFERGREARQKRVEYVSRLPSMRPPSTARA